MADQITPNVPATKEEPKEQKASVPAFEVGKLAPGHTATKWRVGHRIIDLMTISKEEAQKLVDDPSFKVFIKK